jgi:hypothetical protein
MNGGIVPALIAGTIVALGISEPAGRLDKAAGSTRIGERAAQVGGIRYGIRR